MKKQQSCTDLTLDGVHVKKYREKLCPVEILTLARDKVPLNNRELFMHRSRIFFQGKRKGLRDI